MKKLLAIIVIGLALSSEGFCQIQIKKADPVSNPIGDSLVRTLAGFGVQISNISSNLVPNNKAQGTFRSSSSLFPISRGLVMSTGIVDSLGKKNRSGTLSTRINGIDTISGNSIGRQLLQRVLSKQTGNNAFRATDVSSIVFDLIPIGDSVKFKYIFGSDEYPEFVCTQFNDVFGFFIKGPGIIGDTIFNGTTLEGYKNMAKVPGLDLPVTINNVNPGISGTFGVNANCNFTPEGIGSYVSNFAPIEPLYNTLALDGLTKTLTAESSVIPCESYTLVLAIADAGDQIFDSGVFLEMGSMVSGPYCTFFPFSTTGLNDTITSSHPGKLMFNRCASAVDEKWVIRFTKEGTATPNVDYKRLMPNGTLGIVPDSIVLLPGQRKDSIMLIGAGKSFLTKTIAFRYLNLRNPFAFGQPNYSNSRTDLKVRAIPVSAGPDIAVCWFDSARFSLNGPNLSDLNYNWIELKNGSLISAQNLSCSDCRSPKITLDSNAHTYIVSIENVANNFSYSDTVNVFSKKFVHPSFFVGTSLVQIGSVQPGYQYFWKVNNFPVGTTSSTQVGFQPGDLIELKVVSPNGCQAIFGHSSIFTSAEKFEFKKESILISPNPAKSSFKIEVGKSGTYQAFIQDITGKFQNQFSFSSSTLIDVSELKQGAYFLQIVDQKSGKRVSQMLLIER